MKKKPDTKVVYVRQAGGFSGAATRVMKITLVRMPWEPKEEVKEAA